MTLTEKFEDLLEAKEYPALTSKAQMAMMLENTEKENMLVESSLSGDIASFTPILIPMTRRIYPALISNVIAGVQPLSMPTGYIYGLQYRYTGSGTAPISPVDKGQILVLNTITGVHVGDTITQSTTTGTVLYMEANTTKVLVSVPSVIGGGNNGVDTGGFITGAASDTTTTTALTIAGVYSNEALFQKVLPHYSGSYATAVGEALSTNMSEVGLSVVRKNVTANTRKLKAKYTLEMLQDMKAMHGLDAGEELMNLMGSELQFEIDREVVSFVNATATPVTDINVGNFDGRWEIEKYRGLSLYIDNQAREIGRLTRRGSGNKLLVSPKVSIALEALGGFITAKVPENIDANNSGPKPQVGTYNGKYEVVVDNFSELSTDYCTVVYKGSDKDAAVFLAPYVGAQFQQVADPNSGQPAIILSSRYALDTIPLNPENYISNFNVTFAGTTVTNRVSALA